MKPKQQILQSLVPMSGISSTLTLNLGWRFESMELRKAWDVASDPEGIRACGRLRHAVKFRPSKILALPGIKRHRGDVPRLRDLGMQLWATKEVKSR